MPKENQNCITRLDGLAPSILPLTKHWDSQSSSVLLFPWEAGRHGTSSRLAPALRPLGWANGGGRISLQNDCWSSHDLLVWTSGSLFLFFFLFGKCRATGRPSSSHFDDDGWTGPWRAKLKGRLRILMFLVVAMAGCRNSGSSPLMGGGRRRRSGFTKDRHKPGPHVGPQVMRRAPEA